MRRTPLLGPLAVEARFPFRRMRGAVIDRGAPLQSKKRWTKERFARLLTPPIDRAALAAYDEYHRTPLFMAVSMGLLDETADLLRAGADPNVCNYTDVSPLCYATRQSALKLMTVLIDGGANVNHPGLVDGALTAGNYAPAMLLLERGARPSHLACHQVGYQLRTDDDLYPRMLHLFAARDSTCVLGAMLRLVRDGRTDLLDFVFHHTALHFGDDDPRLQQRTPPLVVAAWKSPGAAFPYVVGKGASVSGAAQAHLLMQTIAQSDRVESLFATLYFALDFAHNEELRREAARVAALQRLVSDADFMRTENLRALRMLRPERIA